MARPMQHPPHMSMSLHTSPIPERCQCCKRTIKGYLMVMLELGQRDNSYHNFQDIPEEWSQGWFPFGPTCAKRALNEAYQKRQAT